MNIAVVGTGYVGLVTGTCFAETGNFVQCIDIDVEKVDALRDGKITIYEPGLEQLFLRNLHQGRLKFTTDLSEGVSDASIIFLALPTPQGEGGSADLSYVLGVAKQLGPLLKAYTVIVDKSTVPVGTAEKVNELIASTTEVPFDVVSNPEFLREGVAVNDFMKPERIVIGASTDQARKVMDTIYRPFVMQGNPIIHMDVKSAELTKYAANAFLATKITFMNEIANLCERVGANVDSIRKGIGTDSRIGNAFLYAGIGFGGSCFPKDVQALVKSSVEHDYDFKIIKSVIDVNSRQKLALIPKMRRHFGNDLKNKTIAFWGLTFKPQTDDIREAPSIENIKALLEEGAVVRAHDPVGNKHVKRVFGDKVKFFDNPYEAAKGADAIFISTEWAEFKAPDMQLLSEYLANKVIFDGRNLYDPSSIKEQGFAYYSIGRPDIIQNECSD